MAPKNKNLKASAKSSKAGTPAQKAAAMAYSFPKGLTNPIQMSSRASKGTVITTCRGTDFLTSIALQAPGAVGSLPVNTPYSLAYSIEIGPQYFSPSRIEQLSSLWERYRFKSIKFRFVPSLPTTTTGSYMMICDRDVTDDLSPLTGTESLARVMAAHYGSTTQQIWCGSEAELKDQDLMQNWYTDIPETNSDEDVRLSAQGRFDFAIINAINLLADGGSIGDIYVDYEIEFFYEQMEEDEVGGGAFLGIAKPVNFLSGPATTAVPYANPVFNSAMGKVGALVAAWWTGDTAIVDEFRDSSLLPLLTDVKFVFDAVGNIFALVELNYLGELAWHGAGLSFVPNGNVLNPAATQMSFGNENAVFVGLNVATAAGVLDASSSGVSAWNFIDVPKLYDSTSRNYQMGATFGTGVNDGTQDPSMVGAAGSVFNPIVQAATGALNTSASSLVYFHTVSTNEGLHQVAFLIQSAAGHQYVLPGSSTISDQAYLGISTCPDPPTATFANVVPTQPSLLLKKKQLRRRRSALVRELNRTGSKAKVAQRRAEAKQLFDDCKTWDDFRTKSLGKRGVLHVKTIHDAFASTRDTVPEPKPLTCQTGSLQNEYVMLQAEPQRLVPATMHRMLPAT
jgi:hypothetical protein